MRFYKAAANTGTHIGSLWTADGTRLAQATFTNETRLRLAEGDVRRHPVQIQPDTTYIASYYAPNGHYSATKDFMWPGSSPGPHSLQRRSTRRRCTRSRNFGRTQNGVYAYGADEHLPDRLLRRRPTTGST